MTYSWENWEKCFILYPLSRIFTMCGIFLSELILIPFILSPDNCLSFDFCPYEEKIYMNRSFKERFGAWFVEAVGKIRGIVCFSIDNNTTDLRLWSQLYDPTSQSHVEKSTDWRSFPFRDVFNVAKEPNYVFLNLPKQRQKIENE